MTLSFDYLFNRIYDVLLWIKYTWLFTILRTEPEAYINDVKFRDWDGLRDRGWFDEHLSRVSSAVPDADVKHSLWQRMLESFGFNPPDSDGDGIPDVSDPSIFDPSNLTKVELKERFEKDYSFMDKLRNAFGIGPQDSDQDGVPDSYEIKHGMNPNYPDTDHDGVLDGQELVKGTDPLNNDTDGDLVLDGRDEAPLDKNISSIGKDTDGDGLSDKTESYFHTDPTKKDTDGDGISDNMDTYSLDPNNVGQISPLDLSSVGDKLHLSIQNPVLALFADMVSILAIIILCFFVYSIMRWFIAFTKSHEHYEHHFIHDNTKHKGHIIRDSASPDGASNEGKERDMPAGIVGLPLGTISDVSAPTLQEMTDHPKFAVIQGYLSSQSEALWRIGIMEADNVLLEILNEKGYQGDGVGEKLKSASFKTVELAWDAHKIRNRIAHEGSDFQLTEREAKRAFMLYESVLRDLKAIR